MTDRPADKDVEQQVKAEPEPVEACLLYTSDAADE